MQLIIDAAFQIHTRDWLMHGVEINGKAGLAFGYELQNGDVSILEKANQRRGCSTPRAVDTLKLVLLSETGRRRVAGGWRNTSDGLSLDAWPAY
jgi:hypothetical protein